MFLFKSIFLAKDLKSVFYSSNTAIKVKMMSETRYFELYLTVFWIYYSTTIAF